MQLSPSPRLPPADHSKHCWNPLSSDEQHLIYDGCLEVRSKIIKTVVHSVVLCTEVVHSHKHT